MVSRKYRLASNIKCIIKLNFYFCSIIKIAPSEFIEKYNEIGVDEDTDDDDDDDIVTRVSFKLNSIPFQTKEMLC